VADPATGNPVLRSDNFVPQENLFIHPSGEGVRMAPGSNGGNSWSPVSFSPRTGLVYSLASHQPMAFFKGEQQPREEGRLWLNGTMRILPNEEQYGVISAIDVRTGAIRWQKRVPRPLLGGSVVTAGDVLWVGESSGAVDAFDATNGDLLWQFQAGAGAHGAPMTYAVNGIQYVAIAAGGNFQLNTPRGDDVLVFALRESLGTRALPAYASPRYKRGGAAVPSATRQVPPSQVRKPPAAPR
jgi:glucose dehydrogenase